MEPIHLATRTPMDSFTSKEAVLSNLSTSSQITDENSNSESMNGTHLTWNNSQIRQALSELSNTMATTTMTETTAKTEQSKSQIRWAEILHEFDQPESDSLTNIDNSSRSLLDQSLLISSDTSSRHSSTVDPEKLGETGHKTADSPHIPIEALSKHLDSRLSSMMSELNWSHNELLYKFAQLECKLDQMNKLLVQMKEEHDLLRLTLMTRHRPF
uniref:Uncharacterized protein n=1 Tax=Trichobilharzia regenti TaxID=157069 RepID=A0AA85K7S6_TRIRE|nr:unnamed protein product [Trichobilharzia regenti]